MMTSLAQAHSPYPVGLQHPGVPQGHMAGVPHNPGQQGQPGPGGMPQQMHIGVSGPGPQVSQPGAMMGGMPPGSVGPSAHALQHLNPNQQQALYQQQQAMAYANPQLQHQMAQQQMMQQAQARQRQALMAQQYSGMPVGMPNGMNQMNMNAAQAQFAAMRGAPRIAQPINLPQHLQHAQAQAQAQQTMEHQQAAHAHQQQQQQMIAQQMAMQQQNAQAHGTNNSQGQQGPMGSQQLQNMQQAQAQLAHQQQQAQQQAQAQAQAAAAAQQNQAQAQGQPPNQHPQANPQSQPPQQAQIQAQQQPPNMQQQHAAAAQAAMMQQRQQQQGDKLKGQCLMKLVQFGDHLSSFSMSSKPLLAYMANGSRRLAAQNAKNKDDLAYWSNFVMQFFSPNGVLRHSLLVVDEHTTKQFEITFPALARYFHTHFESGIKNMQLITERVTEKELPNNNHYIESSKSSFVYWFENGFQSIASGSLRAHFDANQKIELLEFVTNTIEEYIPRTRVIEATRPLHDWSKDWHKVNSPPEGKQSPEMNKKKPKQMKSPPNPPPEIDLPDTRIGKMGVTASIFQFLELAEVMSQMNPLFNYSHQNVSLAPYNALDQYVATQVLNGGNQGGQQQNPTGPRTPGLPNFPMGTSPAAAHLALPEGSPRMGGSPNQAPGMQLQQSQHGTTSSGPSANTSPNASNKRRRPSTVKTEEDSQVNGTQAKSGVKPSPRLGKRQKGNPT